MLIAANGSSAEGLPGKVTGPLMRLRNASSSAEEPQEQTSLQLVGTDKIRDIQETENWVISLCLRR